MNPELRKNKSKRENKKTWLAADPIWRTVQNKLPGIPNLIPGGEIQKLQENRLPLVVARPPGPTAKAYNELMKTNKKNHGKGKREKRKYLEKLLKIVRNPITIGTIGCQCDDP